jgi:hypothetical protein
LKTFAAEDGPALRGAERNCGFLSALRAGRLCFRPLKGVRTWAWTRALSAFGLAILAPLGLILETLVGEKHLLAGGEDEFSSALAALQDLIVVFHMLLRHRVGTGQAAPQTPTDR